MNQMLLRCMALVWAASLALPAFSQELRVRLTLDKKEKLMVSMRSGTSVGQSSARPAKWSRWIREANERTRIVEVSTAPGIPDEEVSEFVSRVLNRLEMDEVRAAEGCSHAAVIAEANGAFAPLILRCVVLEPGKALDPWTAGPWTGIGHVNYGEDRRIGAELEGKTYRIPDELEAELTRREEAGETRRWVAQTKGVLWGDLVAFRGIPQRAGIPRSRFGFRPGSLDGLERWQIFGDRPFVIDVSCDGEVIIADENIGQALKGPLTEAFMRRLQALVERAPRERKEPRVGISRMLFRVHPSTQMADILRGVEDVAGFPIAHPRIDLAIAGPGRIEPHQLTIPIMMPGKDLVGGSGEALPDERVNVRFEVKKSGTKLRAGSKAPWQGKGPWSFGSDRELKISLPGGEVESVDQLLATLRASLASGDFTIGLSLDVAPDVTAADVIPLMAGARDLGIEWITARVPESPPR